MSLPEISRRCLSCGAAVRGGSRFCHQCGKSLEAAPGPAGEGTPPATRETQAAPEPTPKTREWTPPTKEFAAFERQTGDGEPRAAAAAERPAPVAVEAVGEAAVVEAAEEAEESEVAEGAGGGDLRGRVARVKEETRARVGRMRDEAIVVLEETPDDSGLRFILAAAALFVAFLVLLFLSTTVLG